eukprot:jgi/Mesvir1/14192/Mv25052-RA.1
MDMQRCEAQLRYAGVVYLILLFTASVNGNVFSVAVTGPPPLRLHAAAVVQGTGPAAANNRMFIHGGFDGVTHLCKRELWSQDLETGVWHLDSHPAIDEVLPASHFGHSLSFLAIRQLPPSTNTGTGGASSSADPSATPEATWGPYPALVMFGGSRCVTGAAADGDVWVWRRWREGAERDPAGGRGLQETGGAGRWSLVMAGGSKRAQPSPRMGHSAVAFDSTGVMGGADTVGRRADLLLIFGGGSDDAGGEWMALPSAELWSLEITDMGWGGSASGADEGSLVATWRQLADAPIPLVWHVAVAYRDHAMLVHGGDTSAPGDRPQLEPSAALLMYNATNDTWTMLPHALQARSRHFGLLFGNLLYVHGGLHVADEGDSEVYDTSQGAWSPLGNASSSLQPSSLVDATAVGLADGMLGWVFGGAHFLGSSHPSEDPSTLTWSWDAVDATWRVLEGGVPAPRVNAALVSAGDSAYLYGGLSISVGAVESCPHVRQQRFDFGDMWRFRANRWSRIINVNGSANPGRRYGHAMEAILDPPAWLLSSATNSSARPHALLVLSGGRSLQPGMGQCVSAYSTDVWVYEVGDAGEPSPCIGNNSSGGDATSTDAPPPPSLDGGASVGGTRTEVGRWHQLAIHGDCPAGREGHSLTLLYSGEVGALPGGPLYPRVVLFGGQRDSDSGDNVIYFNDVWELNLGAATWRLVRAPPGTSPVPAARSFHVCAGSQSLLFCYGGQAAQGVTLGDVWRMDISTGRWSRLMNGIVAAAGQWPGARMAASLAPIPPPPPFHPATSNPPPPVPPQPTGFLLFGGHRSWGGRGLSDLWLLSPMCDEGETGRLWSMVWPTHPDNITVPLDYQEDALGGVHISSLAPEGVFLHHSAVVSSGSERQLVIMGGLIQPEDGPYVDSFNYGTWSFDFSDCGFSHNDSCGGESPCLRPGETRDISVDVVEADEDAADGFRVAALFVDDANGNTVAEVSTDEVLVTAGGVQERQPVHRARVALRRVGVPALGRRSVIVRGSVDAAPLDAAVVDLDVSLADDGNEDDEVEDDGESGDRGGSGQHGDSRNISLVLYTPRRRVLRVVVYYRGRSAPMPGVRVVVEGITDELSIVSGTVAVQPAAWTNGAGEALFSVFPNAGVRVGYILHFAAARAPAEGEASAIRTNVFVLDTEAATEIEQVMDVAKPTQGGGSTQSDVFVSVNLLYFEAGPPFHWPSLFAWLRGMSAKGEHISHMSAPFMTNDALDTPFVIATERSTLLQGVPPGEYMVAIWEGNPAGLPRTLIRVSDEKIVTVAPAGGGGVQHAVGAVVNFYLPMMLVRVQLRYPLERQGGALGTEGGYPIGGATALFFASREDPDTSQGTLVPLLRGVDEGYLTSTTGYVSLYVFTSLYLRVNFSGGEAHHIALGQATVSPSELDMSRRSLTVVAISTHRQLCNGLAKLSDSDGWFPRRLSSDDDSPYYYSANVPTCVWLVAPSAVTIEITLTFYFLEGPLSLAAGDEILIKDASSLVQQAVQVPSLASTRDSRLLRQRVFVRSSSVQVVLRTRSNSLGGNGFVVEYSSRTVRFVDFVLLTVITIITVVGVLLCCLGCCVWTRCYRAFCMDLSLRVISYMPGRQHLLPVATRMQVQRADLQPTEQVLGRVPTERLARRRTPGEAAAMLERVIMLVYRKGSTQLGDDTCSICLCDYEDGEFVALLFCQHAFHGRCLGTWLQSEEANRVFLCPFCKSVVRFEVQTRRRSAGGIHEPPKEPPGRASAADRSAPSGPLGTVLSSTREGSEATTGSERVPHGSSQAYAATDQGTPPPHLVAAGAEDIVLESVGAGVGDRRYGGEEAASIALVPLMGTESDWGSVNADPSQESDTNLQDWPPELLPSSSSHRV